MVLIFQLVVFTAISQPALFIPYFPEDADNGLWEKVILLTKNDHYDAAKADSLLNISIQHLTKNTEPAANLMVATLIADYTGRLGRNPGKGMEILISSGELYRQANDTLNIAWVFRYATMASNNAFTRNVSGITTNFENAYRTLMAFDNNHPAVPILQYNLMQAFFQMRRVAEGFSFFHPLIEYSDKNNDWFHMINAYLGAGNIIKFYNPGLSRKFMHYAYFLAERYHVTRHLNDPFFYISLGSSYTATMKHEEAMELYKTGLETLRRNTPQNKSLEGNFLYYIGVSYGNMNNYKQAIAYLDSAAALEKELAGKTRAWYRAMGLKGKNLNFASRFEEALKINQEVFDFFASSGAQYDGYYYQNAIRELMVSNAGLGNYQLALYLGQKAIFNFFGMDPPNDIFTLPEFSQLISGEKNYQELEEAIYLKIDIIRQMAEHESDLPLIDQMLNHFEAAASIIDMHASIVANPESLSALSARFKFNANKLLDGLAAQQATQTEMEMAYMLVARSKAYLLQTENARNQIYDEAKTATQLADQVLSKRDITSHLLSISPDNHPEEWESLNRKLLFIEKDNFVAGILNPVESRPLTSQPLMGDHRAVSKKVQPDELVMDFYVTNEKIHTFLITSTSFKALSKPIPENFNELSHNLFRYIRTGNQSNTNRLAQSLGKILFDGIDYDINKKHVIIIPDEKLHALPFDLLVFHGKPLLNTMSVSYRYSSHLFRKANTELDTSPASFLTLAPVFDLEQNIHSEYTMMEDEEYRDIFEDNGSFIPIPATLDEISELTELLSNSGMRTRSLQRLDANMENFVRYASEYDIIHLATHGFSNSNEPEKSGLALFYGVNALDVNQHPTAGLLMLGQLSRLDLQADLVVLSACKSGYGTIQRGEGIMGISRGFISAGANHVVASLWKVHDQKTKEFMVTFYSYVLEGHNYHQALRLTKLSKKREGWLIMDWAGFILIGA